MLTETNTIAAVLGTDLVPPVVAFKEGYEGGARIINPDINLISTYHPVAWTLLSPTRNGVPQLLNKPLTKALMLYSAAGGKTGNGALIEVAGDDGAYCIGVDSDQWETVPEAHPVWFPAP